MRDESLLIVCFPSGLHDFRVEWFDLFVGHWTPSSLVLFEITPDLIGSATTRLLCRQPLQKLLILDGCRWSHDSGTQRYGDLAR